MTPSRSKQFTGALKQTAVYWGSPVASGSGGRTFAEPVELSLRWEQKQELFIDARGQEVRSNAVVFVSQDVSLGTYLFLGDLDDLDSDQEDDPMSVSGAYEIRGFEKIPDRRGTSFLRKVYL
jgi:hypothetical protein